jgi:RNA polymerase sigma factor (sigma-70 family)
MRRNRIQPPRPSRQKPNSDFVGSEHDVVGRLPIHPHRPEDGPASTGRDSPETLDIAALTKRLVAGDDIAYRRFFDAYFHRLSRYLLVVTAGNEDAAREALQDTFRRVVRHIRVFTDEEIFWSWLTVLARSARSDENRKRLRYLAFLDRFAQHAEVDRAASVQNNFHNDLEAVLERGMGLLPVEERALLELKYFRHCPVREIAGRQQTTEKAVESRLARVRQKLGQLLLAELKHASRD